MSHIDPRSDWRGGRRSAVRRDIMASGSALTVGASISVLVENISLWGAKLRGRNLPAVGKQVLVWMDGADALGVVTWADFDQRGVSFETALDVSALMRLAG